MHLRAVNVLSVASISKSLGERVLFQNLSFGLDQGQKLGLLGRNGCGKTTLLRMVAGMDSPDQGEVRINKQIRVAYLEQDPLLGIQGAVMDAILHYDRPQSRWLREYYDLTDREHLGDEDVERMNRLHQVMEEQGLWEYQREFNRLLGELEIPDLKQDLTTLSGGQRKRVALAALMVADADLILLDEPTNHLDLHTIEWLENRLKNQKTTLLLVTHDRYFLESVCNGMYELEQGKLYYHQGNYASFLENKETREQIETADAHKAKAWLRKELEWMRRQPKARGTKSKARIDQFYKVQDKVSNRQVTGKLELDGAGRPLGGKILEISYLRKSYGDRHLIHDFTYNFVKGDRVGIIGRNGLGKSTLLNLITGQLRPDGGEVEKGEQTVFGYYKQENLAYKPGQTVLDRVREVTDHIKLSTGREISAADYLNRFLFPPKQQHDKVDKLSGGEKRRLQLLLVLIAQPNFLIMDEPTNDLDLVSLQVLEDFLEKFKGCLLLVSHDRYFMDRLVDHLLIFEGEGKVRDFPGNYTDYRLSLSAPVVHASPTGTAVASQRPKTSSNKPTFAQSKRYQELTQRLETIRLEQSQLLERLNAGGASAEEYAQWSMGLKALQEEAEKAEWEWLELSELMGA
ncbi:MAG: ABC-F family ATP-binding cassette domain-containing protein [Sphingomonadales bacterium]|nr:ABC-F family ATP-binding cassette domain-containing protein [Sphingomonadales bacterium]